MSAVAVARRSSLLSLACCPAPQVKVLNSMSHPNLLRFHTW